MTKYRSGRINEEAKKEISYIIQNDIKDPRLTAMVSVTDVDITKDLKYAKVFLSIFGNDEAKKSTMEALKSSIGFIRREMSQRMNLRNTPEIVLKEDTTMEKGMHIDSLLQKIKEESGNETK